MIKIALRGPPRSEFGDRVAYAGPLGAQTEADSLHRLLLIPGPRAIARHALPNVIEGKVIPLVLFLGFLDLAGTTGALLAALGWSGGVILYRFKTGTKISGLVLLSTIGLLVKTFLALVTGSLIVYFLQPTISTALVGIAFFVSVAMGNPLAARLARDICPFDENTADHPMLRLFFTRLSLLWAFTSLLNAGLTLWLLLTQSTTTFVIVKSFLGPSFTVATLLIAALWFRQRMKAVGMKLQFGSTLAVAFA